jgi:DNA-binding MarR family transcriptional regulator
MNSAEPHAERIAAVRAFNRFYTHLIGVVSEGLLETPYSLTEARVIFELAQRELSEVAALRRSLDLDAGYLSRILSRFAADGLIRRERSADDARRQVAGLTDRGREVFRDLDARSGEQIGQILAGLPEEGRGRALRSWGPPRG